MSEKFDKIIEDLSSLTVLEAAELVKALEEKWGVSASAPVAVAAPSGGGEAAAEKTEFNVELTDTGAEKLKVIKELRGLTGLGLIEAKKLVESTPQIIKEAASKEDAEAMKTKLEGVGAKVTLK